MATIGICFLIFSFFFVLVVGFPLFGCMIKQDVRGISHLKVERCSFFEGLIIFLFLAFIKFFDEDYGFIHETIAF